MSEFGWSCLTHYLVHWHIVFYFCGFAVRCSIQPGFILLSMYGALSNWKWSTQKNSIIKWGRDIPALFLQWRRMMSVTSVWYYIFYTVFWCPCFCFLSGSWISAWEDHSREPSYKLCRTTTCTGRHNWSYPKAYTSSSIILRMNLKSYFWEALLWYVSWWTLGFETLMTSKNLYFCCIITHMMDLC